jgi:hypothetical protein
MTPDMVAIERLVERLRAVEAAARLVTDDGRDHPDFCQCEGHVTLRGLLGNPDNDAGEVPAVPA